MKIRDLFVADVTRDIPPVVYFHEQSPEKLAGRGRRVHHHRRLPRGRPARPARQGRHPRAVRPPAPGHRRASCDKPGGPELPPPGSPASTAPASRASPSSSASRSTAPAPGRHAHSPRRCSRATTPRGARSCVDAWNGAARRGSTRSRWSSTSAASPATTSTSTSAALRQVQARLGYCSKSHLVADVRAASSSGTASGARSSRPPRRPSASPGRRPRTSSRPTTTSPTCMHVLDPERYRDPMSWIDSRAGSRTGAGTAVKEVVDAIEAMLDHPRARARPLFIVVDEVSQYVHQDDNRMLKLQSLRLGAGAAAQGRGLAPRHRPAEARGQRPRPTTSASSRTASRRACASTSHPTNIRDVVHKRLLAKKPAHERMLRELFQKHRPRPQALRLRLRGDHRGGLRRGLPDAARARRPAHADHVEPAHPLEPRAGRRPRHPRPAPAPRRAVPRAEARRARGRASSSPSTPSSRSSTRRSTPTCRPRWPASSTTRTCADDALALRAAKAVALLELIQEQSPTDAGARGQCLYRGSARATRSRP